MNTSWIKKYNFSFQIFKKKYNLSFYNKTFNLRFKSYNQIYLKKHCYQTTLNMTRVSRRIGTVGESGPLIRRIRTTLF